MMVNIANQFTTSFQKKNLTISTVANIPWCIGKNGEETMHALYALQSSRRGSQNPIFHLSRHHNLIYTI